jgi:hypothetical protein
MDSGERSWHFTLARAFREKNFVFITNLIRMNAIASLPPGPSATSKHSPRLIFYRGTKSVALLSGGKSIGT